MTLRSENTLALVQLRGNVPLRPKQFSVSGCKLGYLTHEFVVWTFLYSQAVKIETLLLELAIKRLWPLIVVSAWTDNRKWGNVLCV